jgi:hypothetical protein
MKATVEYYDIDTDKKVEKKCFRIDYESGTDLSFCPVDEPVKIYKDITICSPSVKMVYSMYGLKMFITGWQMIKDRGYWKTETIIKIENESI